MTFGIVPATKWQLKSDIGQDRRKRLLEASFDRIAHQITNHAEMDDYGSEPTKKCPGANRVCIKLILPHQTVDLFHNGAGGYRAQFYLGVEQGQAANRYVIDSLLAGLECDCAARPKQDCCWEFIEASLRHRDAKIWIHEGAWLTDNKAAGRNLIVDRWKRNAPKIPLQHRFEPIWAKLTPDSETRLELKGGAVDETFQPIDVLLKPSRSRDLHDHGYT